MKLFQWLNQTIFKKNLTEKAKASQLTDDDWTGIAADYEAEHPGRNFQEDLSAAMKEQNEAAARNEQERAAAIDIVNKTVPPAPASAPAANTSEVPDSTADTSLIDAVQRMATAYEQMAAHAKPDVPEAVVDVAVGLNGPGTNATHFLGIPSPAFSMEKRWNQIAANPGYAVVNSLDGEDDSYGTSFRAEVRNFGKGLMARFAYLRENGMLETVRLNAFTNDYSGLGDAKLGDRYIIRRQDALIARLIQHADIYAHFPRRFNVQDSELMISAFFSEVSQAWQRGEVFKGSMDLQPEIGYVDDAMIKLNFPPMEEIERLYIGYLNKEFSAPMKLSMIEFQYVNIMETALNEQFHRKIMGIYVKPQTGVPGSYLTSSTGLLYTLIRYFHESKLLPIAGDEFAGYTDSTILDVVSEYCLAVKEAISDDDTLKFENLVLFLNKKDQIIWKKAIRAALGKDIDFTGPDSYLFRVPDIDTRIVWLDNLGKVQLLFMEEPGNIQFLENKPGEMFATKMFERFEEMLFSSRWKEGTSAEFVGRKFNSLEALTANAYKLQRIFINKPSVILAAGASSLDGTKGFWFQTVSNAAATAVTDVTGAKKGVAYILEIGDVTNASTVAKSGKFSEITAAFSPTKKGDYLMFILNETGDKFLELERSVGGVRTINVLLQPNVPGAR